MEYLGATDVASWKYPGLREQLFLSLLLQAEKRQDGTTQVGVVKLSVEGL